MSILTDLYNKVSHDFMAGFHEVDSLFSGFHEFIGAMRNETLETYTTGIKGFVDAIDWTDTPMLALASFYVSLVSTAVMLRHHHNLFFTLMVTILGLTFASQYSLPLLSSYHKELGFSQDYFETSGLFVVGVFCAPMLCIAFIMMFWLLYINFVMLIKVKRLQARSSSRQRKANGPAGSSSYQGGSGAARKKKAQ